MDITKLINLAKAVKEEKSVINISASSPSVLLRSEDFDQFFPKWTDEVKGQHPDGTPYLIKSIVLDGVTFESVTMEVPDGVGG